MIEKSLTNRVVYEEENDRIRIQQTFAVFRLPQIIYQPPYAHPAVRISKPNRTVLTSSEIVNTRRQAKMKAERLRENSF